MNESQKPRRRGKQAIHHEVLRNFVYAFVYPGILGSMLYECLTTRTNPAAYLSHPAAVRNWTQVAVLAIFLVDFFYVYKPRRTKSLIANGEFGRLRFVYGVDLLSVLLLLFAFVSADSTTYPAAANFLLVGVAASYFVLQLFVGDAATGWVAAIAAAILGTAGFAITSGTAKADNVRLGSIAVVAAIYALLVFLEYRADAKKQ